MKTCKKCLARYDEKEGFYRSKRINRYPDGYLDICKKCLKKTINNNYIHTFIWVLEEVDVPFFYDEWVKIKNRHPDSYILGRYLTLMKLKGYAKFTF